MSDEKVALLRCVRRRGRGVPHRGAARGSALLLLDRRAPRARDAGRVPPRPVLQRRRTRSRTSRPPAPRSGDQTAGRVTHFVAGVGTGGTITGVGRCAEGAEPRRADRRRRPVGLGVLGRHRPAVSHRRRRRRLLADHLRSAASSTGSSRSATPTRSSPRGASRSEEGLLIGGSGGTAVHAALEIARPLGPDAVVVVLLPDSGRSYLSKIFDDQWMFDMGFLRGEGLVAGDVLAAKGRRLPDLVLVHARRTGARRDHGDARDRRVAGRRERHEGAAARGEGGRRARSASSS